ncbi:hypothetical protein Tco_0020290, partial [Tanacetum coccineum]
VHNFVDVVDVKPNIENITLEEYSNKALEYWDSDMEIIDDVYYKLPPLEPCFQTSHPYNKSGFVSPNENDEIDIDRLDGVPDNLFKIGAENLRKMKQEKVQVVECDGGKLEEIWDITVEDVESLRKLITPIHFISQTIYTTPPDDAYVVSDTKPILDELLEEFRDKLLKIAVFDEEADCNPVKDIKELLCIMKTNVELESFIQQLNPLHGEIQSSKLSTKTGSYGIISLPGYAVTPLSQEYKCPGLFLGNPHETSLLHSRYRWD